MLAARRRFEETSSTAARGISENAQRSAEASEKANEANKQFTEKVQKIEGRVRELIDKRAQDAIRNNEIQVNGEDDEEPQDEVALEYQDLIENYPMAKPAETAPQAAEMPQAPGPSAGTAGQVAEQPAPDPRWQVQVGRFGRRNQQPEQSPAAAPKPPSPPKPAPRRQRPAFDDDEDYENQTWLR
ncbi:hypothetical protein [Saccharopolyspora griseoalba]|uniref:Uncharacterized protein n=1 Tax=Saccharopolyspora griseoalba TaxID=1431848 RepID=A0ABW2LH12_9PSEU